MGAWQSWRCKGLGPQPGLAGMLIATTWNRIVTRCNCTMRGRKARCRNGVDVRACPGPLICPPPAEAAEAAPGATDAAKAPEQPTEDQVGAGRHGLQVRISKRSN